MLRHALIFAALVAPMPAFAANDVALTSEMFVERSVPQPGGQPRLVLEKVKSVPPGAKLVFVLTYANKGRAPATNFVATNPVPNGAAFGGATYGPLAAAKARAADGSLRPARPDEVTHVRWALKAPIPVAGSGKLSFRGSVK